MSILFITGYEHGVDLNANGGGLIDLISGTPDVQSTIKRSGTYALSLTDGEYAQKTLPTSAVFTIRFYVYFDSLPADAVIGLMRVYNGASDVFLYYDSRSAVGADRYKLKLYTSGSTGWSDDTVTTGQWYRIDIKIDGTNQTGDFQVDGVAGSQISLGTSGTFDYFRLSGGDADTIAVYDDVIISDATGDYPIGEGEVIGLSPNADGTHNNAGEDIEDNDGNPIDGSTYYGWNHIDKVPLSEATVYLQQARNDADAYVEVAFDDLPAASAVNGAMGLLAYNSPATQANEGSCYVRNSDPANTEIWGGPDPNQEDYSESAFFYKSAIVAVPSGGWDKAEVDALLMRMGHSGDANPDPYWRNVMIEVDYVPGAEDTELVVAEALHAHAADAPVLTQAHVLAIAEALHLHAADSPALIQAYTLAMNESLHAHSVDNIDLTQVHILAIAESLHDHLADNIDLTQAHVLAIQEALHSHSTDPIALFQAHQLAVDDALHDHFADNIVLDLGSVILIVADALHGHSAESPVLTQAHVLAIAEALHNHFADGIDLIQAYTLIVAASEHAHSADNITLSQVHNLLVESGLHALASDPIVLSQIHSLLVNGATHAHLADNIALIYGDKYPILFQVEPRERIFNVKPRKRLFRVEPRDREIGEKKRGN